MENDWKNQPSTSVDHPPRAYDRECECFISALSEDGAWCARCGGVVVPPRRTMPAASGFRLVDTPLACERRAFWREAFHSVDWDRTREADEVTKMCAKFADAALEEFDKRFNK